jgi:hypothetical protein
LRTSIEKLENPDGESCAERRLVGRAHATLQPLGVMNSAM